MDEWAVDLPGSPSIVPLARNWVGEVLRDVAPHRLDDMILITSEYVTNSVRHSVAADGEQIHLRIQRTNGRIRLEVEDGGERATPEKGWTGDEADDFGRGLAIVAMIADEMGDETTDAGGRLAWAVLKI